MEQHGDFLDNISRLESNLSEVRGVWADQIAQTYDHINENIESFTMQIWQHYCQIVSGCDMVKANYNEAEFESELTQLNYKIHSV